MSDRILAAVMPGPNRPIEIREYTRPQLAQGAALLRTTRSEVCGTDVHLWHGRLTGVPYPIIPGHVSTGTLDAVRGPLRGVDGALLREGDRVAFFDVHRTCGRCRPCAIHRTPTRCIERRVYGITDSAEEGLYGGWAQAIYLEPGVHIAQLPDPVTFDQYIGGGCGLLTAVHIIERAGLRAGETVLVQGTGAVGLSTIALARFSGASLVLAIGAPANRIDLARRLGADRVFDLTATSVTERLEQVRALTHGEGVDVVVEAAGSARAFEEGPYLARDGGRYVVAGHYTDAGTSAVNVHTAINRKHLDIRGCWGSEPAHFLRALTLLERLGPAYPFDSIGERTYRLDQLNAALTDTESMRIIKALVDPWASV